MATFYCYATIPAKQINKDKADAIKGITKWFKDNPKRRVCRTQLWYGKYLNIKQKTIKEQIEQAAKEALSRK